MLKIIFFLPNTRSRKKVLSYFDILEKMRMFLEINGFFLTTQRASGIFEKIKRSLPSDQLGFTQIAVIPANFRKAIEKNACCISKMASFNPEAVILDSTPDEILAKYLMLSNTKALFFKDLNGSSLGKTAAFLLKEYFRHPAKQYSAAVLRETLDTTCENFIFQELGALERYQPFFVYKNELRRNLKLDAFKIDSSKKSIFKNASAYEKFRVIINKLEAGMIEKILSKRRPKLIQCPFLTDAAIFSEFIKRTCLPVFVSVRGFDLYKKQNSGLVRELEPYITKFIAKSRSISEDLVSLGCPPEKIEVIHSGIDLTDLRFKLRTLDKNNLKILSCGRFVEKKGFDTTLLFFNKLLKKYPRTTLTLIGEGPIELKIRRMIDRYDLRKSVKVKGILPHRSYVNELYDHNIFVLPSKTAQDGDKEGIPNVLKEAMASGMPVISTYHSGIPELIQDGINGYLVNEGDYLAMAAKIDNILKDNRRSIELCWRARFKIEKDFNLVKTAKQLESQYDRVLLPESVRSVKDLADGRKPLQFRADLHLIAGCNNKCIMCDNWKNPVAAPMAKKEIFRLLDSLKAFGVNYIRFHGQEPLLRKDIFCIMEKAKKMGFFIGVKTNALLINKKNILNIAGLIDNLYLSLDSDDKAAHNYLRGNAASFDKNIGLIKEIKNISPDIKVFLNTVVTAINLKKLVGILDIAKNLRVDRVSFVHLNKNNKNDLAGISLNYAQMSYFYQDIYPKILLKSIKYGIPVQVDPIFTELVNLEKNDQLKYLMDKKHDLTLKIKKFTDGFYGEDFYSDNVCFGVLDHVTIDWEGNIYPCCAMPRNKETALGNIRQDTFINLWKNERYVNYRNDCLEGKCAYKNSCSRNFKDTAKTNDHLRRRNIESNNIFTDYNCQLTSEHAKRAEDFSRILAYSFLYSDFYKNKITILPHILKRDEKLNFFVTKSELKDSFSSKENLPDYFKEDYSIYRTSTCGTNAFLFARPLRPDHFDRMAVSFFATGKWKYSQPWIKLTSDNCLEAAHPVLGPASWENNKKEGILIIPAYENYLTVQAKEIKRIYHMVLDSNARLIHANPTYLKLLLYKFSLEGMVLPKGRFVIHSTYENFTPSTINFIKKILSCECYDQYGCSEVGPISFTCSKGNRHIFSDTVKVDVESADELGRNDIGRVIVTHLKNTVMPIVRYFNGDFALQLNKNTCKCGFKTPIMGQIAGRENEIIKHHGKSIFPLDIDKAFVVEPNLLLYQVIYTQGEVLVKCIPISKKKPINFTVIREGLKSIFKNSKLMIDFEIVDAILPSHRGKFKTVLVN